MGQVLPPVFEIHSGPTVSRTQWSSSDATISSVFQIDLDCLQIVVTSDEDFYSQCLPQPQETNPMLSPDPILDCGPTTEPTWRGLSRVSKTMADNDISVSLLPFKRSRVSCGT